MSSTNSNNTPAYTYNADMLHIKLTAVRNKLDTLKKAHQNLKHEKHLLQRKYDLLLKEINNETD